MIPMGTLNSLINSEENLKEIADKTIGIFFLVKYKMPDESIYYKIDEDLSITGKVDSIRKAISDKVLIPNMLQVTDWGGSDPNETYGNLEGYCEETKDRIWFGIIYDADSKYCTPEYEETLLKDPHYKFEIEINEIKAKFLIDYDYQIHVMQEAIAAQERIIAKLEGKH